MLKTLNGMLIAAIHDRKGIAAMEYAILAAAVLGAIGVAFTTLGTDLSIMLGKMTAALASIVTT